jgi:hypothetical protein
MGSKKRKVMSDDEEEEKQMDRVDVNDIVGIRKKQKATKEVRNDPVIFDGRWLMDFLYLLIFHSFFGLGLMFFFF